MHSSGLSVYNSQWTNSATHSGPLRQLLTMNCDDLLSPSNCRTFQFFTLKKPNAVCLLQLLCACIQLSVLKALTGFIIFQLGQAYLILWTQWRPEIYEKVTGEITWQILRLWGWSFWIFIFVLVCNCRHVEKSVYPSHCPHAANISTQCTQNETMIKIPDCVKKNLFLVD